MMDSEKLAALRREYSRAELSESAVDADPFNQFAVWFDEAINSGVADANAMTLSTVSSECTPSARVVLLKGFSEKGYVFFTNYESKKAVDLLSNPNAVVSFFWQELERQVIIGGKAEKTSQEESEIYFRSRPFESRLAAWASRQSSVIESREVLQKRIEQMRTQFNNDLPLPPFWGGFRLVPGAFEFWQGRPNRLHDRICYEREGDMWTILRRSP